jgi:hypothetical protein
VSARRAHEIARRLELLELEAELQRLTLAATIAQYEQMRLLSWASGAGRLIARVLAAAPRVRWLLVATLWRKLMHRMHRKR